MLLFLLLFPGFVQSQNPIKCPGSNPVTCQQLGYLEKLKNVENIQYTKRRLNEICGRGFIYSCFGGWKPSHKWCYQFSSNRETAFIGQFDDMVRNFTDKYEKHGVAIADECLKYSMGPYDDGIPRAIFEKICPEKVEKLNLTLSKSSKELVQRIRHEFNLIPENLKAPARRFHKRISAFYASGNESDIEGMKDMFADQEGPLFLMGLCWCQDDPDDYRVFSSYLNYTVVEHVRDSPLVQQLHKINATKSFLLENEWDIAFNSKNITLKVPWLFVKGKQQSIECELQVTYSQLDFFEENPKMLNQVRLVCPFCRFEDEPACFLYSKLPNWAVNKPANVNKTEAESRVYDFCGGRFPSDLVLPKLTLPSLIMTGGQDRFCADPKTCFLNVLKNSRWEMHAQGGHDFHLKYPKWFAEKIQTFVGK